MTGLAITGMHRAGTSMVAHALSRAGVYLGAPSRMLPPAPDNPEGFFEHASFVRLADDLLEACGGAWDHVPDAAPFGADDPRVAPFASAARELVHELDGAPAWGWKDPRTCLTANFWTDVVPGLRVVICVRHPLEVAVSLRRRNGTSYLHALALWRGYYAAVLDAVPIADRIVTHYDAHLADPSKELDRLSSFAGLPPAQRQGTLPGIVDRGMRHHRLDLVLADAGVDPQVVALYEKLCEEASYAVPSPSSPPVAVDRRAVDLALAQQSLERFGRYVTGLQKDLAEQTGRVADLESAGQGEVLAELTQRLDALEDAQHDARYEAEDLSGHPDPDAVRAGRALVRTHVPRREQVLVAGGGPALLDICGRSTMEFPTGACDDVAAVARLEAMRLSGVGCLLMSRPALPWLHQRPGFADHLLGRYAVMAEDDGLLIDVRARTRTIGGWPASISVAIERLVAGGGAEPAILDWTGLGLARYLSGRNVFTPPDGHTLPYLDRSIDIVAVVGTERLAEARRVGSRAVIILADEARPRVATAELIDPVPPEVQPGIRYVVAGEANARWRRLFTEAVGEPVEILSGAFEPHELTDGGCAVAVVEPGVLPLPGCEAAVRSALADERTGAVAVKLLDARGALESAGETVFADGSWARVAAGSAQVSDPWHDYVRNVCGGSGLLYLGAAAAQQVGDRIRDLEPHPMVWAAAVWRAGLRVRYQPAAVAVRAAGMDEPELLGGVIAATWAPALTRRPSRPQPLDTGAWRKLLARDDVEGAWG